MAQETKALIPLVAQISNPRGGVNWVSQKFVLNNMCLFKNNLCEPMCCVKGVEREFRICKEELSNTQTQVIYSGSELSLVPTSTIQETLGISTIFTTMNTAGSFCTGLTNHNPICLFSGITNNPTGFHRITSHNLYNLFILRDHKQPNWF